MWDGLFHAQHLGVRRRRPLPAVASPDDGYRITVRSMVGLLLAGWGIFNLVEGIVDHHLLTIHHVRDDVADPLWWDLGFLAFGAILVALDSRFGAATPTTATRLQTWASAQL